PAGPAPAAAAARLDGARRWDRHEGDLAGGAAAGALSPDRLGAVHHPHGAAGPQGGAWPSARRRAPPPRPGPKGAHPLRGAADLYARRRPVPRARSGDCRRPATVDRPSVAAHAPSCGYTSGVRRLVLVALIFTWARAQAAADRF